MRQQILWVGAFLVAALIVAQTGPMAAATKTHEVTGTIVSVDVQGQKITFKDEATAATSTAPVLDKAVESLKTVKAGDKVVLTCRDNERGDHEGVIAIRPAQAAG